MNSFAAIVPVYNNWKYLDICIQSILAQTRLFDEIIIVDDASSEAEVRPYLMGLSHYKNVSVIFHDSNSGIVASQNDAVMKCNSDYIAFVDCDDLLERNALEIIAEAVAEREADYYFTDRIHIDEEGNFIDEYRVGDRIRAHGPSGIPDLLLDHMVASHLKVLRRSTIDAIGGFVDGTEGVQDWDLALKMSEVGRLEHIPIALYSHRIHASQNSTEERTQNYRKTNLVRRNALLRREIIATKSPEGLARARAVLDIVIKKLLFSADAYGSRDYPLGNDCAALIVSKQTTALYALSELKTKTLKPDDVVILICQVRANIGLIRLLSNLNQAVVCMVVLNNQWSIAMAQWFNSYCDIVAPISAEAELGILGYCSPGIEVYRGPFTDCPTR